MKLGLWITVSVLTLPLCLSCDKAKEDSFPVSTLTDSTTTIDPSHFVTANYIELDKIGRISKFRSLAGHDYHDDFEQCRSMKHYFEPKSSVDWSSIKIVSPVKGSVTRIFDEWAGTQVQIQSEINSKYIFIIFHITLVAPLKVGDQIALGQQLGTHIGSQTMSDIAVGVATESGYRLISYFDTLNDSLFQLYQLRGVATRNDMIISKEARDADSVKCSGDAFLSSGTIGDWVVLK